jgi:hypothetical protein
LVHCDGRRDTKRLSAAERSLAVSVVMGKVLCAMRE